MNVDDNGYVVCARFLARLDKRSIEYRNHFRSVCDFNR